MLRTSASRLVVRRVGTSSLSSSSSINFSKQKSRSCDDVAIAALTLSPHHSIHAGNNRLYSQQVRSFTTSGAPQLCAHRASTGGVAPQTSSSSSSEKNTAEHNSGSSDSSVGACGLTIHSNHDVYCLSPEAIDAMLAEELPRLDETDPMFVEERQQTEHTLKTLREDLAAAEAAFTPAVPENERTLVRTVFTTMLACTERMATLRKEPTTIGRFLEMQMLDVRRDRCRHAVFGPFEREPFQSEEEKGMSAEALRQKAFLCLDGGDSAGAIHCLRLAAVHHGDCTAMMALHGLNAQSPDNICRSASLLYQFATVGDTPETIDGSLNAFVANEFRRGTHFFPPFLGASAFFYQRAVTAGHEASLYDLYRLFSSLAAEEGEGASSTINSSSSSNINCSHPSHAQRAQYFLEQGAARGRIDALLTSALQHIVGLLGVEKNNVEKARGFLEKALELSPELKEEGKRGTEVAKGVTIADLMRICSVS